MASSTIQLRDRLRSVIQCSPAVADGLLRYKQENGSDSLIEPSGRRILKLMTPVSGYLDASLLIALNVSYDAFPERLRAVAREQPVQIKETVFRVVALGESDVHDDSIEELLRDTVANLVDAMEDKPFT